jgi:hypothetical protein
MRPLIPTRDRAVLIGSGVLLLLVAGISVLAPAAPRQGEDFPCSYAIGNGGAKATYLLLKELGYEIDRWDASAEALPEEGDGVVLIAVEPFAVSEGWKQRVVRFARAGGRVLVTGSAGGSLFPGGGTRIDDSFDPRARPYRSLVPSPLTRAAPVIRMASGPSWHGAPGAVVPLYGDADRVVAVSRTEGRGRIVWWSDATPITNAGLDEDGNLSLLLDFVGPVEDTQILWDEASHGHGRSLLAYLAKTPLPWGMLQLGLLFLAVCLSHSRRSGPERAGNEPARHSPLEFVKTLGELYRRAGAAPAAVEVYLVRFKGLLARRLGVPMATPAARLAAAAAARLGADENELLALLGEADVAVIDPATARECGVRVAQRLQAGSRALETGGRLGGEVER